jgi:hypothetical protein
VAVDHVENDPGEHGDGEEHEQARRQQEATGRLSVQPLVEESHQSRMAPQRTTDCLFCVSGVDRICLDLA